MKIAYCGYDFFGACLTDLLQAGLPVYRVFSYEVDNRFLFNRHVTATCASRDIPLQMTPVDGPTVATLENEGCDVLITAAYAYRIPPLAGTGIRGINVHPSLLPVGRGSWPMTPTILSGHSHSGVTIHKLAEDFDTGDILAQEQFPVAADENLETLSCKAQMLARRLLLQVVRNLERLWDTARPQGDGGCYWPVPSRQDRTLRWEMEIARIDRIARACGKFGCFARINGRNWVVYDLTAWPEQPAAPPGTVVHRTNTETVIAAADGLVCLRYFERERTPAAADAAED